MQKFLNQLKKDNNLYYNKLKRVDYSGLTNILNYLDDNFDLYAYQNQDDYKLKYFRIGFKVPDYQITNTRGYSTNITDFVIMPFFINEKNKITIMPRFMRESWDFNQCSMRYVHSHVNRNFNDMCMGTSDHLKSAFYNYDDLDTIHYNVTTFIESLKWESLEGGPYTRIKTNKINEFEIYESIIDNHQVSYDNNEIKVTFDDVLFRETKQVIQRFSNNQYKNNIYYKNGHKKHIKTLQTYEEQTYKSIQKIITEKYYGEAIADEIKANREPIIVTNNPYF